MENQISDIKSVNSSMSSTAGSFTEHLKVASYLSDLEQSLKVFWVCDEWSRCDSKEDVSTLCKHDTFKLPLGAKQSTMCLTDFHGANVKISLCV